MGCGDEVDDRDEREMQDSSEGANTEITPEVVDQILANFHAKEIAREILNPHANKSADYYSELKANGSIDVFTNLKGGSTIASNLEHVKTTYHADNRVTVQGKDLGKSVGEQIELTPKSDEKEVDPREVGAAQQKAAKNVHYNYYSAQFANQQIHVYTGLKGEPEKAGIRPHVHTVFQPKGNRVDITGTQTDGTKVGSKVQIHKDTKADSMDGNEINRAISEKAVEVRNVDHEYED